MKFITLSLILVLFALLATKSVYCRLSLQEIIQLLQQQDEYYPYLTGQGLPGLPGNFGGAGGGGGGAGLPGLPGMPGKR